MTECFDVWGVAVDLMEESFMDGRIADALRMIGFLMLFPVLALAMWYLVRSNNAIQSPTESH